MDCDSSKKIDYDRIAGSYDAGRSFSEKKEDFWLGELRRLCGLQPRLRVVDVGCGTGRFAIPIAVKLSCDVVGVDVSRKMLKEAVGKMDAGGCAWVVADAQELPLGNELFDLCLVSMVIHHLADRRRALAECHRVVVTGGTCVIRTVSHEQLTRFADYTFFPRTLEIDLARVPDVPVVCEMLDSVGFGTFEVHEVMAPIYESAEDYLNKVRSKHSSSFHLISDEEYREGLQKAEEYFSRNPLPEEWKTEPISVIVATKGDGRRRS